MATTPAVSDVKYSMLVVPADGVTRQYEFNFAGGYISRDHIKIQYENDSTGAITEVTDLLWVNANTIALGAAVTTIPVGNTVTVYRDTPKDQPLVDYTDGAIINEANLDRSFDQAIFASAEMVDRFLAVQDVSETASANALAALTASASATATANTAAANASNALTQAGQAVATANTANSNASTALSTANGIDAKATTALANSSAAVSTANGIDAKATTALSNSNTAVSTANAASSTATAAQTTANAIDSKAQTALDNSATALSTANTANTTAAAVDTKATTALSNSSTALSNANAALDTVGNKLDKAQNLADLNSASTARTNLGVLSTTEVKLRLPAGMIAMFPTTTAPSGWLALAGQLVTRASAPDLWAFAQASGNLVTEAQWPTAYGSFSSGDGSSTFRLPEWRGEFVRSWDNGRGVDASRSIGAPQAEMVGPHTHAARASVVGFTGGSASLQYAAGDNNGTTIVNSDSLHGVQVNSGTENRVRNVAALYCIKT